jgi:ribosome-binding factor A
MALSGFLKRISFFLVFLLYRIFRMNTRQDKVAKQIQKDMAEILPLHTPEISKGQMLTVTGVRITSDLGLAHIYISVFPSGNAEQVILGLNTRSSVYRNELGIRLRYQLRKVPEIMFHLDDSLDYIENIENLLKK